MGLWPDRPYDSTSPEGQQAGNLLANGYFGVLWAVMGDLDYMASVLNLPRYSSAANPCSLCRCSSVGVGTWTDNRPNAGWMEQCWTSATWLAWDGRSKCPLFSLPGVTALTVCLDYMHCKYLGMDQYMFGSDLYLLVHHVLTFGTPQENLNHIWIEIKQYYGRCKTPCRFRYLNRLSMFMRRNKTHKLRGKAAEIKYFGVVLLWVWNKYMNQALAIHRQISLMLQMNLRMETILTLCRDCTVLTDGYAEEFKQCAFDMAQLNSQVSEHFLEDEEANLFVVTTKLHMVMHCALLAKHINPRLVWCFSGEDMMKHGQILASSCVKCL